MPKKSEQSFFTGPHKRYPVESLASKKYKGHEVVVLRTSSTNGLVGDYDYSVILMTDKPLAIVFHESELRNHPAEYFEAKMDEAFTPRKKK